MDYYITYRNKGKAERTPVFKDATAQDVQKNVKLLKAQGATSIIVHRS